MLENVLFNNLFFILMQGPYTLTFYFKILLYFSLKALRGVTTQLAQAVPVKEGLSIVCFS